MGNTMAFRRNLTGIRGKVPDPSLTRATKAGLAFMGTPQVRGIIPHLAQFRLLLGTVTYVFCILFSFLTFTSYWCGRGDSNPHALRRHPLKMVRLPVPPLPHEGCRNTLYRAAT